MFTLPPALTVAALVASAMEGGRVCRIDRFRNFTAGSAFFSGHVSGVRGSIPSNCPSVGMAISALGILCPGGIVARIVVCAFSSLGFLGSRMSRARLERMCAFSNLSHPSNSRPPIQDKYTSARLAKEVARRGWLGPRRRSLISTALLSTASASLYLPANVNVVPWSFRCCAV
eukprot:165420-Prorocentrum_minimum.AAC.3